MLKIKAVQQVKKKKDIHKDEKKEVKKNPKDITNTSIKWIQDNYGTKNIK